MYLHALFKSTMKRFVLITSKHRHYFLLLPPIILLVSVFLLPFVRILQISFYTRFPFSEGFTFGNYARIFGDMYYWNILKTTILIAIAGAALTTVLGLPLAYLIWRSGGTKKVFLIGCVIVILFIDPLPRLYGWTMILGKYGPLNNILMNLGVISQPTTLLFNFPAVVIGVTHMVLPYFILIMISTFEGIDWSLVQAARVFGAGKIRAFREVTLPLVVPGLCIAEGINIIWGLGAFAEPSILGSPQQITLAKAAADRISVLTNWSEAAAISIFLIIVISLFLIAIFRLSRKNEGKGGG